MSTITPRWELFPHIKPLTDEERAARMADAVWNDIRSTYYGPALLRKHHASVNGRPAYRFPYADRAYLLHREAGADTWAVTLYAAPSADDPAATVEKVGTLVTGQRTQRDAVAQLVRDLYGTKDDHGYGRGRDSCPGCDHFQDAVYDDFP
ncbi:hypothetical protein ABZ820_12630 [Streptomyces diacarni]|uniref:hypothetical protein n=1 Tax=Streptomyces diacarni TaxID=2800381 RepID=UPI0033F4423D